MANYSKIVLASSNTGKIKELSLLLKPLQIEIIPQSEFGLTEADETGLTFIENAIIKARHAARLTGLPALADDSGLAVAALNGAPGIHSARYAGDHVDPKEHIAKLLQALRDAPDAKRHAQFHCVLALLMTADDPAPIVCDGIWSGTILHEPRGEQGFGYDPVFFVPSANKAAAELTPSEKNQISHRGKTLQSLITILKENQD